jgi:hypothetical protein
MRAVAGYDDLTQGRDTDLVPGAFAVGACIEGGLGFFAEGGGLVVGAGGIEDSRVGELCGEVSRSLAAGARFQQGEAAGG